MENIFDLLEPHLNQQAKGECFYYFCSQNSQPIQIKRLFLNAEYQKVFNSDILSYGLKGALQYKHDKSVQFILDYMKKNNFTPNLNILGETFSKLIAQEKDCIPLLNEIVNQNINVTFNLLADIAVEFIDQDKDPTIIIDIMDKRGFTSKKDYWTLRTLQFIFNCATTHALKKDPTFEEEDLGFACLLDERYNLIKNSLTNEMPQYIRLLRGAYSVSATLNSDGSLETGGAMGGPLSDKENKFNNYALNPFLFSLEKKHFQILDKILHNNYLIHPSLILHALVSNTCSNNQEAVYYLFSNEKCSHIIKNSSEIRSFINCDSNYEDIKSKSRNFLLKLDLDEKIVFKNDSINKNKL